MTTNVRTRPAVSLAACAALAALCLGASGIAAAQAAGPMSALAKDVAFDQKLDAQVPLDLVFRDEHGKAVKLGDYFQEGKPVILTLVYFECPMMCTQVLNGLVDTLKKVNLQPGQDFEMVTVSFDPGETPELAAGKKNTYVQQYGRKGAAEGWHFLTGDEASIKRLTSSVGFRYVYYEQSDQFAHASGIMVLTPEGRTSRYFYGIAYPPQDVRLGLVEASQNKIGSLVDQVLLLCYHYDPTTARYGFVIMSALRLAGAFTVLLLALSIGWMLLRERRRRAAAPSGEAVEAGH